MRVTDTDLLIVVEAEPDEEQNKRDLPIIAEGRSRNMRPFFVCVCGGGGVGGRLIHVLCVTHHQTLGGGETAPAV